MIPRYPLRVLRLQFFDVLHQLVLVCEAGEIEADHLISAKCRLLAGPSRNQHAGDDRAIRLEPAAVPVVS